MSVPDDTDKTVAGVAALSIRESLLTSLNDRKILDDKETRELLEDAASVHRMAIPVVPMSSEHCAVAALTERLIESRAGAPPAHSDPVAAPDHNIEMVAPAVQVQTDSER